MNIFKFKNKVNEEKQDRNLSGGFTLVETLVAIAIFSASITGLISITARGINDSNFVKNKLTASYLAAEGIELIRNFRDTAVISNPAALGWSNFLALISECYSLDGSNYCAIDPIPPYLISPCPNEQCPVMTFDSASSTFSYNSTSSPSSFTRYIKVQPVSTGSEIIITSEVRWLQGSTEYTTSYQYNLFNWF